MDLRWNRRERGRGRRLGGGLQTGLLGTGLLQAGFGCRRGAFGCQGFNLAYYYGSCSEGVEVVVEHVFPCLAAIQVLQLALSSIHHLSVAGYPFGGVANDLESLVSPWGLFLGYQGCQALPVFSG